MKLIYCCQCQDVIKLLSHERHCDCGACGGHYINDVDAVFWGDSATPLGFESSTFARALEAQPEGPGKGKRFDAFVIPQICPTMAKLDLRIKVRQPDDPKDVHTEHCCVRHGCKYGDDLCSVVILLNRQSGPCEECRMELTGMFGEQKRQAAVARWPDDSQVKEETDEIDDA